MPGPRGAARSEGAPSAMKRFGLALLAIGLVLCIGGPQAVADDGSSSLTIQPKANLPQFEIDGFKLRDVGPYSGIGAIRAVPCWRIGVSCDTAPSGAAIADAIWNTGTRTFANAPITPPPQRYQLLNPGHLRTLLLGDGMPRYKSIIDQAANAGYEAIMVNWEHTNDPSLQYPIGTLRRASQWTRQHGMKFGVAIGGKIMRRVCLAQGFSNCP